MTFPNKLFCFLKRIYIFVLAGVVEKGYFVLDIKPLLVCYPAFFGTVAEMVQHLTVNEKDGGSNPSWPAEYPNEICR